MTTLAMLPCLRQQFFDDNGVPLADGSLAFFITGTGTPLTVYSDQTGTPLGTTASLDSAGRSPQIYISNTKAYTVKVYNSAAVLQYTITYVADPANFAIANSAVLQMTGTTATSSPYTVASTDNRVTVNSATANFVVSLPTCASRGTPLFVFNASAVSVRLTPNGAETLNGFAAYITMPPASAHILTWAQLYSDGVSNWNVCGSDGLV